MKKLETYELVRTLKALKALTKRDMTASGIRLSITHFNETNIGEFDFKGENLPKLLPILIESLTDTLEYRRDTAAADIKSIDTAIAWEVMS